MQLRALGPLAAAFAVLLHSYTASAQAGSALGSSTIGPPGQTSTSTRDGSAAPQGKGAIRGRVTAADTGVPLKRA